MTVTNAAARVATNTEIDTKASTLDLSELRVLGVRFPEPWLLMLQCLLIQRSDREFDKVFSDHYATEHIPNIKPALGELSASLQNSRLLEPIFQN